VELSIQQNATDDDAQAVRDGLARYNAVQAGEDGVQPLRLVVRDEAGTVRGGLLGATYWGWLVIEILWLDESIRGQDYGTRLVQMAERIAVERGCHAAHLDTMSFQAPAFYHKLGYRVFGQLEDLPLGHRRIFMQKRLVDS
jgi:GNAT superfamily N-acetyltransferase